MEHVPCSASEVEESDTCFSIDLFGMNELKATSPIMKQVNVNGKPMNFQVDTGSSFTIMGYDKYEDFKDKYGLGQLKSVVAFPRTFTGEEVKMKGQVTVQVNIDQFSKKLSIWLLHVKALYYWVEIGLVKSIQTCITFSQWNIKRRVKIDKANLMHISFHMCFSQVNELDPVCCNLNCILVVSYLNITLVSHIY